MVNADAAEIQRQYYESRGRDLPQEIIPPDVMPGVDYWLALFWELSTDRQIGMGAGPIPAASIDRVTAGWPDDDAAAFRHCVRMMDREFLRVINAQPDAATQAEPDQDAKSQFRGATRRKRAG